MTFAPAVQRFAPLLVFSLTLVCAPQAHAIPKAAEHENAPVTFAADMARPKPAAKSAAPAKGLTAAKKGSATRSAPSPAGGKQHSRRGSK